MMLLTIIAAAAMPLSGQLPDRDNDGIPDAWEVAGHGPIRPSHGCSPTKQDMFVLVCIRPQMHLGHIEETLSRVKQFFSEIPGRNLDGTPGINVIFVMGPRLRVEDRDTPYHELYERYMPEEWRGIAHGILLEPGTGGGGQTRGNWSGISNNWHTVVHELGHQLGLGHEPRGSAGQSPLYASLMNYDYSYSFAGDPNKVHFSTGKFASVPLNEQSLSERMLFSADDLDFLRHAPYRFKVVATGLRTASVDWNRNGVQNETRVRAQINDGYSLQLQGDHKLGKAAGSPTLLLHAGRLIAVYPDLVNEAAYASHTGPGLTPGKTGRIVMRMFDGTNWGEKRMLANVASGDPHAVTFQGRLALALPIAGSYTVQLHDATSFSRQAFIAGLDDAKPGQIRWPVLVATSSPEALWLFLWNETSGEVTYRKVNVGATGRQVTLGPVRTLRMGTATSSPIVRSQTPVHATYDPDSRQIVLVTGEQENAMFGRLRLHTLAPQDTDLYSQSTKWVTGAGGYARTRTRPWVMKDPAGARGTGGFLVYHKGEVAANDTAVTYVAWPIGDTTVAGGWRVTMMGNEWMKTQSATSAVPYRGEVAYAMRGGDHELLVLPRASGIETGLVADFDDVTHIRTKGLKESLGR